MAAISALLRGRRAAEKLMIDQCIVRRVTGKTQGPGGVLTPVTTVLYEGKCRLMVRTRERLGGSWVEAGEAQVIASRLELHIPTSAPEVQEGDRVEMVSSTLDPLIAGKVFVARDSMVKTFVTARRITVIEVSS